jgi:hypothetical protein
MEGKRNKKRGMGGGEASTGIPYAPSTGSGLGLNGRGTHSRHASGPPADANGGGSAGFKLLRRPASGASVGNGSFAALASASDTEGNGQPDGDSATEPEEAGGGDTSAGEGESAVSGAGVVRVRKGRAAQLAAGDGRGPGAISPLLGPLEEEEDEAAPAVPQVRRAGEAGQQVHWAVWCCSWSARAACRQSDCCCRVRGLSCCCNGKAMTRRAVGEFRTVDVALTSRFVLICVHK